MRNDHLERTSILKSSDGKLSINIHFKRRSGRRLITLPDRTVQEPRPWDTQAPPTACPC